METRATPSLAECLAAATDTDRFVVAPGALAQAPALFVESFPGATAFVVADGNTMAAAGTKVLELFRSTGIPTAEPFVFPALPVLHGDMVHVAEILAALRGQAGTPLVPVSVGSGTINDMVKRAAFEFGSPYLCVPTAASVDGYTSYGAALLGNGFKKTFTCPAPKVVVADSDLLAAAPAYLSSSGFGDLASKIVAGSDWIIAEAAGRGGARGWEPIEPFAWAMTQNELRSVLRQSENAAKGDAKAVGVLFEALALTGFSMQHLHSSRPVSGCEHLFSHVWEMHDLSMHGVPVTHGHKVAVGTLLATALTELLFASPEPPAPGRAAVPGQAERSAEVRAAFSGLPAVDDIVATSVEKLLDQKAMDRLVESFRSEWAELRTKVLAQLMPYGELKAMLVRAGCPVTAQEIGLGRTEAITTARKAQMIRNRYTALDLAWDLGLLEDALERMENSPVYLR